MWSGIPVTDVLSPGHYFASYRYDTSGNRDDTTRIRITTHDTKYDASSKWGGYPVVGNPAYLEFNVPDDGRSYMAWLYTTDYQVSATVPMHYTDGYIGKFSDQVGGVANTIDIGNPTIPAAVSVDDTIQLAKYTAANNNEQDLLDYNLGQKLEPSTKYRISFVARGNVGLNIYLYPGAAPSPDGTRQDGRVTQNLSNDFHTYSYELTTFGSFSGDPNKQLLFRFPSNSNGGFVEIYPSSVRVEKVGGVSNPPVLQPYNLLNDTSDKLNPLKVLSYYYLLANQNGDYHGFDMHQYAGKKLSASVWIENPEKDTRIQIWTPNVWKFGNFVAAGTSGWSKVEDFEVPETFDNWNLAIGTPDYDKPYNLMYKYLKLEQGDHCTSWQPHPSQEPYEWS